ncbi:MAG: hypothetical protein K6F53_08520 [Lachnospiraceae bacterium]|nr:hypothetical protein [Lachnospiraceae bacterium]
MIVRDVAVADSKGKWRSKISLVDRDGKTLKDGTDFDSKKAVFTYDEGGNDIIPSDASIPAGTIVYVRADAKGKSYTGSVTGSYLILQKGHDISKLKVKVRSKSYTGKAVKLTEDDISFKSGKKTVEGVQFVIDASTYRNNVNKGTASVEIRGTGDWGGTVGVTYKIGSRGLLFAIFD